MKLSSLFLPPFPFIYLYFFDYLSFNYREKCDEITQMVKVFWIHKLQWFILEIHSLKIFLLLKFLFNQWGTNTSQLSFNQTICVFKVIMEITRNVPHMDTGPQLPAGTPGSHHTSSLLALKVNHLRPSLKLLRQLRKQQRPSRFPSHSALGLPQSRAGGKQEARAEERSAEVWDSRWMRHTGSAGPCWYLPPRPRWSVPPRKLQTSIRLLLPFLPQGWQCLHPFQCWQARYSR